MNYSHGNENSISEMKEHGKEAIKERVENVRHMVDNVRDRAEIAFRDKPYLVPVAAGALGFGVGLLFGSKLMRFVLFTAVGTLLTESLGGEIKRLSKEFAGDLKERLEEVGETDGE
jgi:tetrahydromethanopterin S-methyltransferase subunit F